MAAPQVTVYSGEVPQRTGQTQEQFSANMNNWVSYYDVSIPEINAVSTFVSDSALEVESNTQVVQAVVSQQNFLGAWSTLTGTVGKGATLWHDGLYWSILDDIADVTLSEPSLINSDYALTAQAGNYVLVQSPFTLVNSGRYYVLGSDTITIPDPTTLADGQAFDFSRQPNEEPTIFVGTDLVTTRLGLTDGVLMGVSQTTFIVRNGLYEV